MKKILVTDPDGSIRRFVSVSLRRAGFHPVEAESALQCLDMLRQNPDLRVVLTELNLPDCEGFELCRRIRAFSHEVGIIILSARNQEMDKVTALNLGADDYVVKPFSSAELVARIDALCRRVGTVDEPDHKGEIVHGPFRLNTRNRVLEKNGERIRLTQIEYALMQLFMTNPGTALSREDILAGVWGESYYGELKVVDVNIRRLRIKIEDEPTQPEYITTVWGYGYKWGF